MNRRPNPAVTDPCGSCLGWGSTTVRKGTDYQDEIECLSCNGSGRQTTKHEIRRHDYA